MIARAAVIQMIAAAFSKMEEIMPASGEILSGLYQVKEQIGKGGAGLIYKAYHLNLHKYVVVKKIKDNFVGNINARGEADILKSLHHTCLPQVYDFLQIGREIYTVMDYIEGHDLKYYIDRGYSFPEEALWSWLEQLADVLDYLHKHGILHMDIKPANIMLTGEGNICLIDFNISLSGEGQDLTGISEAYASPEQYRKWYGIKDVGIVLDERTDIYSLGATFYHIMTGYLPSSAPSKMLPISQIAVPYSEPLVKIVGGMTVYDRNKRYQNAAKVKRAIQSSQRTKAEKYTLRAVFAVMLCSILILCITFGIVIFCDYHTTASENIAVILNEEKRLDELCKNGEYELAETEAVEFLNTEYAVLEKVDGARQSILERLADAYIGMENYSAAASCLAELQKMEQKAEYFHYEAIIAAHTGQMDYAEEALNNAIIAGGDETELEKSRAEIAAAQKKYDEAVRIYKEVCEREKSIIVIRRIAYLSLCAAADEDSAISRSSYASDSIEWYELLLAENMASYNDKINLATAYSINGLNQEALSVLQGLAVDYPDRYEAYLQLGIMNYNAEIKKAPASRDFSKVLEYASKAKGLYDETNMGEKNEQLDSFLEVLSGVH